MIKRKKNPLLRFLILIIFVVYLFPAARIYSYAPYIFIGVMFIFCLFNSGWRLKVNDSFLVFTLYTFTINLLVSGYGLGTALKTSLFIFVPFMAIQIGFFIARQNPDFPLWKVAFALLLIELVICLIQYSGTSIGSSLMTLYGSEKYSSIYDVVGHLQRCIGTLANPNACGVCVVTLAAIVLNKSDKTKVNIIAIICTTFIVLITKSRTSLVCEMLVLFIKYANVFDTRKPAFKKIGEILFLLAAVVGIYSLFGTYISRDISMASLQSRIDIWENLLATSNNQSGVLEVIYDVFGLGLSKVKTFEAADNEYLFVLLSCGWAGLCIWVSSILRYIFRIIKMDDQGAKQGCMSLIAIWLISAITMAFYTSFLLSFLSFVYLGFNIDNKHSLCEKRAV